MEMETETKQDNKSMDHVMLNEVTQILEEVIPPIEQYDYMPIEEMQPMEQDIENFQTEEQVQNDIITESDQNQTEENQMQESEVEIIVPEIEEKTPVVQAPVIARTIAPKPTVSKLIGGASGQQIVFIQGPNSQTGQTMRLVSSNSTSTSTGSFQLVKRSDGVMQLRQAPAKVVTSTIKKIAPAPVNKNLLTKVIVKGNNHVLIGPPSADSNNAIKILPLTSVAGGIKLTSPTKTITLAQAQNMGLLRNNSNKLQVVTSAGKVGIKTPMKILPAPSHGITPIKTVSNQNIIIKQSNIRPIAKQTLLASKPVAGTVQPITMPTSLIKTIKPSNPTTVKTAVSTQVTQVIKIQAAHNTSGGQIHQINVPGRGIQYVRLVSNSNSGTTTTQAQISKNATFTTKAVLKQAPGIKPVKSTVVSIRPAVTAIKTVATTKPTFVKTVNKYPDSIMTSRQSTANVAATVTNTTVVPSVTKVISDDEEVKEPKQTVTMQQAQHRRSSDDDKYSSPMEIDSEDLPEERISSFGRPIFRYYKQEIKRELSLENLNLIDKRGKDIIEANGIRPRKPCNCTRSQCLKLYCDCFANGEFCNMCNCKDCMNNIENEDERQKAIRSCLDRNPSAFRPKIGKAKDPGLETIRRHNKGCNCKRSGCLKNYCECFEAKIACSNNCKCVGCRNIEDCLERKRSWAEDVDGSYKKFAPNDEEFGWSLGRDIPKNYKWPVNYITPDVIEATCQCLLAQADEAIKNEASEDKVVDEILEEFGRCLVQIIECFNKTNATREDSS